MVQSISASHTLQTMIRLYAYLFLAFRAILGFTFHLNPFDSLIDRVSYGENDVIYEHEEAEEIDKCHEYDEDSALPLDDRRYSEDRVESDESYSAQSPEKLFAFVLLGAAVDGLVAVLSRALLHHHYNKKIIRVDQVNIMESKDEEACYHK